MVRLKNRYLLGNILYPSYESPFSSTASPSEILQFYQPTDNSLTPQYLIKAIRNQISELFGDYGTGAVAESLAVKYLSLATSTFIIRVARAHYRLVWAALSFMNSIPVKNGRSCVFRVVRVSGTMKLVETEAIRNARELVLRARRELGGQGDAVLEGLISRETGSDPSPKDPDIAMVDDIDTSDNDDLKYH